VALTWRVRDDAKRKPRPALDQEALGRLGLFYAGRYGTTRAKLRSYLVRKVRERGWAGVDPPAIEQLAERFAALGYVDDAAFATARTASLLRRGYGGRRIDQALHAAGIEDSDAESAREQARDGAWAAALRFAERKRIGPFAGALPGRDERQKAAAAMIRAGHSFDMVRKLLAAPPGEIPELDGV